MNEQFLKLATQSGIAICQMVVDGIEYDYQHVVINDHNSKDEAAVLEKFAQLIVKECIAKITLEQDSADQNWQCKNGVHITHELQKHFGIE